MRWTLILILPLAFATIALAGRVTTSDGRICDGEVRFDQDQITVKSADQETRIDPEKIQQISFDLARENNAPVPKAPTTTPAGHGWSATYFRDPNLAVPLLTRIDPVVDFDWRTVGGEKKIAGPFSAAWAADLIVPKSGEYRFTAVSHGGLRVSINAKPLIDHWRDQPGSASTAIQLESEKPATVLITFFNSTDDASLQLRWSGPGFENQPIPVENLIPVTDGQRRQLLQPRGLLGEYFDDEKFNVIRLRRHDASVDFRWAQSSPQTWPDPQVPLQFAVRWTGRLRSPGKGQYTIFLNAADACRVLIDGKAIIDSWKNRTHESAAPFLFRAGQSYGLKLEYSNRSGVNAEVHLAWAGPGLGRQIINADFLSPPPDVPVFHPQVTLHEPATAVFEAGEIVVLPADVVLEDNDHFRQMQFFVDGRLATTTDAQPCFFAWPNPRLGLHGVTAVVVDNLGFKGTSATIPFTVATKAPIALGQGWMNLRIGKSAGNFTSKIEAVNADATKCTITAGAGDLWSNTDSFRYIFRALEGDGSLTVRLNSLRGTTDGNLSSAGLMIRRDLTSTASEAAIVLLDSPAPNVVSLHRDSSAGEVNFTSSSGKPPIWLRIQRTGTRVRSFDSIAGDQWNLIGDTDLLSNAPAFIGLAVAAHTDGSASAVFDHIEFKTGRGKISNLPAGIQTITGSVLAGSIQSADSEMIHFRFHGRNIDVRSSDVAALLFHPVPIDTIGGQSPGMKGALLNNGDIAGGDFTDLTNGRISISSVLFGRQNFAVADVVALLLNDVRRDKSGFAVTASDASIYFLESIRIKDGKLLVSDPVAGELSLAENQVRMIAKFKPKDAT